MRTNAILDEYKFEEVEGSRWKKLSLGCVTRGTAFSEGLEPAAFAEALRGFAEFITTFKEWKYGESGRCHFESLTPCSGAALSLSYCSTWAMRQ
jgi:hypothetical protein